LHYIFKKVIEQPYLSKCAFVHATQKVVSYITLNSTWCNSIL